MSNNSRRQQFQYVSYSCYCKAAHTKYNARFQAAFSWWQQKHVSLSTMSSDVVEQDVVVAEVKSAKQASCTSFHWYHVCKAVEKTHTATTLRVMRCDKHKPQSAIEKNFLSTFVGYHDQATRWCVTDRRRQRGRACCTTVDFNCAGPRMLPPIARLTQARFRVTAKKQKTNAGQTNLPWSKPTEHILSQQQQSCHEAHSFVIHPSDLLFSIYYNLWSYFTAFFSFLTSSLMWMLSTPPPPSISLCHSAHLGCLVELGTSVPVRGAQWGPVEDTKGGLLQLPVTLRPTQQLFGVYTSVLNPHTQPYHKGTSLAPAQRRPLLTPS